MELSQATSRLRQEGYGGQARSTSYRAAQSREIRSYAELQEQLHRDLLAQNPEWIDSDGNSPMLDWYDQRLAKLISTFQSVGARA